MLDVCPRCFYSLKGLPTTYKCPECGLRYDEYSRSWTFRSAYRPTIPAAVTFLPMWVYFLMTTQRRPRLAWMAAEMSILTLLSVFLIGRLVLQHLWIRKRRLLVAPTPDGLFVRALPGRGRLHAWPNLAELHLGTQPPFVAVRLIRRLRPLFLGGCFVDFADGNDFKKAVDHYRRAASMMAAMRN